MSGKFSLDDYVDVAERIRVFRDLYPDGSLQSEMTYMAEPTGWLCVASAYRNPDDLRPGVGHAFEPVPGKTPYTRDSECQNAETAAWGRAIVALGFETKKIASKQEVQARQETKKSAPAQKNPAPKSETVTQPDPYKDTNPPDKGQLDAVEQGIAALSDVSGKPADLIRAGIVEAHGPDWAQSGIAVSVILATLRREWREATEAAA